MMNEPYRERAVPVKVEGASLGLIVCEPKGAALRGGVLIVVGGPQTRVGSHRQFVLLARALAASGFASVRFDARGQGDSDGEASDFTGQSDDIDAARAVLASVLPPNSPMFAFGLCDAASALLLLPLPPKSRNAFAGLILANPWVRSTTTHAQVMVSSYYHQRLASPLFWKKVLSGNVPLLQSMKEYLKTRKSGKTPTNDDTNWNDAKQPFQDRMAFAWHETLARGGQILLVTSGQDLTAEEFLSVAGQGLWASSLTHPSVTHVRFAEANHTFSSAAWRSELEKKMIEWIEKRRAP